MIEKQKFNHDIIFSPSEVTPESFTLKYSDTSQLSMYQSLEQLYYKQDTTFNRQYLLKCIAYEVKELLS